MLRYVLAVLSLLVLTGQAPLSSKGFSKWRELRSPGLVVLGEVDEERLRRVGRDFSVLARVLAGLGLVETAPQRGPLTVYVFRDQYSFKTWVFPRDRFGTQTVGVFRADPGGRYVAINASEAESEGVVYHELIHELVDRALGRVPLWFDEGVATLYETFRLDGDVAVVGEPKATMAAWLREHPPQTLRYILDPAIGVRFHRWYPTRFYAESWSFVHQLLLSSSARREGLARYLTALAAGADAFEAVEPAFGVGLDVLEAEWKTYAASSRFRAARTPVARVSEDEAAVRPITEAEFAARMARLVMARGPDGRGDAQYLLANALRLDPRNPQALAASALLSQLEGKDDAAELYERAIAAGADDAVTFALAGTNLVERRVRSDEDSVFVPPASLPADIARARDLLRLALASNPDDPEILTELGRTWMFDPGDPADGLRQLARAGASRPQYKPMLHATAVLLHRSGDIAGLESLLSRRVRPLGDQKLTRWCESALDRAEVRSADAALELGDREGALAAYRRVAGRTADRDLKRRLKARMNELEREAGG